MGEASRGKQLFEGAGERALLLERAQAVPQLGAFALEGVDLQGVGVETDLVRGVAEG